MPSPAMDVSLVCTVLNEVGTVTDLMQSIAGQTMPPREVIIVDGGSRDGTQLHVEWWHGRLGCPLRLIELPGANISTGRNAGIAAARSAIIAVTDAGVRLEPDWLAKISAPFADPSVGMVGGFFVADPCTIFETAMGASVLPARQEIVPASFLPSSRSVAFLKSVWEAVGGYPEWLDYCEDIVFDLAVVNGGTNVAFAPDAVVHFRPRGTVRAYWHQYFRYARGDGKANLWARRHAIRYATYLGLIVLIAVGRRGKWLWPLAVLGAAGYLRRPYQRLAPLLHDASPLARVEAALLVPTLRAIGDAAKMCGYPVGVVWRLRNRRRG